MKCTSAAANAASAGDFGKLVVEVLGKTHYNRGVFSRLGAPVFCRIGNCVSYTTKASGRMREYMHFVRKRQNERVKIIKNGKLSAGMK